MTSASYRPEKLVSRDDLQRPRAPHHRDEKLQSALPVGPLTDLEGSRDNMFHATTAGVPARGVPVYINEATSQVLGIAVNGALLSESCRLVTLPQERGVDSEIV